MADKKKIVWMREYYAERGGTGLSTPAEGEWMMSHKFIDGMEAERLRKEIERLEYEKPRIVQWTRYDEDRLQAYREVEFLRKKVMEMCNRIEDDSGTMNRLCESKGFFTCSKTSQ